MDIERNVKQASTDVDAFLSTGGYVADYDQPVIAKAEAPVASRRDFLAHFGKWENGKVLLGAAWSWVGSLTCLNLTTFADCFFVRQFALDVAFYGLGLNSSYALNSLRAPWAPSRRVSGSSRSWRRIILGAIGYGSVNTGTPQYIRFQTLYNLSVGNIILSVAGRIPGYWVSFLFIDSWGRKPIQLMGFVMLTITLCCMVS
jgi:MFS transporter, PHS family, inorganic phosphate transporter